MASVGAKRTDEYAVMIDTFDSLAGVERLEARFANDPDWNDGD